MQVSIITPVYMQLHTLYFFIIKREKKRFKRFFRSFVGISFPTEKTINCTLNGMNQMAPIDEWNVFVPDMIYIHHILPRPPLHELHYIQDCLFVDSINLIVRAVRYLNWSTLISNYAIRSHSLFCLCVPGRSDWVSYDHRLGNAFYQQSKKK